jgi:hypothetical protein
MMTRLRYIWGRVHVLLSLATAMEIGFEFILRGRAVHGKWRQLVGFACC